MLLYTQSWDHMHLMFHYQVDFNNIWYKKDNNLESLNIDFPFIRAENLNALKQFLNKNTTAT